MRERKRIIAALLVIILLATGTMSHINAFAVEALQSQESNSSAITKLEGTKKL